MRHLALDALRARRDYDLKHGDWEFLLLAVVTAMDDEGLFRDPAGKPHNKASLSEALGWDTSNGSATIGRLTEKGIVASEKTGGKGDAVRVLEPSRWVEQCFDFDPAKQGLHYILDGMYQSLGKRPGEDVTLDRNMGSMLLGVHISEVFGNAKTRLASGKVLRGEDTEAWIAENYRLNPDNPRDLEIIRDLAKVPKRGMQPVPAEEEMAEDDAEAPPLRLGRLLPDLRRSGLKIPKAWDDQTPLHEDDECEVEVADADEGGLTVECERQGGGKLRFGLSPKDAELWSEHQVDLCWRARPQTATGPSSRDALGRRVLPVAGERPMPLLLWRTDLDVSILVDLKLGGDHIVFRWQEAEPPE